MAKKKTTFDVKSHILVPKHTKLSQKDTKDLFERLKITVKELPKISMKDPAIQNLEVKPGDVIKVERASPTAGRTVYYRGVVGE
jgi:DNA-directed RNA polymerase subunit H